MTVSNVEDEQLLRENSDRFERDISNEHLRAGLKIEANPAFCFHLLVKIIKQL